jgi:Holliday junction resolvase
MNSRAKGKAGELELAAFLRDHGIEARRGVQFSGGADSPDVVTDLPNIHIECKRTESAGLYGWLGQAIRDAGDKMPVVFHRRNNCKWVVVMRAEDFLKLVQPQERW